ncbi:MAG TPA: DNA-formamidopyrimidine glycosylase [Blastocatellia bacterium]|nr:DNA-formamidopyrimidine glycosylase [Blastocatellia bacterium]
MPELPEVENRLLYFRRAALGERVEHVVVTAPGMIKSHAQRAFARLLVGRSFVAARRRGKYLIVALDDGRSLILHFGMGGDLAFYNPPEDKPPYTRIEFIFESGARLAFTCPRKICRVLLVDSPSDVPALREMGPEPEGREFSLAYLGRVIEESPSRQIKPLLMDQKKIAGVGNIYADEILFEAKVRPDRRAHSLAEEEIKRIHRETRRVLKRAIETGGDENFPSDFLVSRSNAGARCKTCGHPIEKKKIAGRTAYFCPQCQS